MIGQLLRPLDGLRAFQFRQHDAQNATLYLVKSEQNGLPDENLIRGLLAKALPDVTVKITYVSQIQPTASGKMRYAIRECELPR